MSKMFDSIYRVLPVYIQNSAISYYGNKTKKLRFNDAFANAFANLEKTQYYSKDELIDLQNQKLRHLIAHIYENVPYYREIFDKRMLVPADIRTRDDLHKLPILRKKDVKENFNRFIARNVSRDKLKLGHTSGTTGTPFEILWDRNTEIVNNAVLWRHRSWGGFNFGDKYATLLGRVIVPLQYNRPPFHRINRPWNQYLFSSFHLAEKNIGYYFDEFEKQGIRFLEAYPSTAYILARHLAKQNAFYKMKAVFTSSETLLPIQRELIENRFQCKVFDYYGSAERVMFSGECEKHKGHHLCSEYGVTEIINTEDKPVSPGQYGRAILTGLHNLGMPLIRYEIGDICSMQTENCTCGRGLPLLGPITTKAEDIVILNDGRLISASVLTHPFKPLEHIEKSQIIQEDRNTIMVKLVKRAGYSDKDTKLLLEGLRQRLGEQVTISIDFVADIPPGANGKFRWVISKVPLALDDKSTSNLYSD